MFNVAVPSAQFVDGRAGPASVHAIQQQYGVNVSVRIQQKQFANAYISGSVKQLITVRGSMCDVDAIIQATSALFELFTGHKTVSLSIAMNYYYNRFMALWILSGTTRVSQYQKGKTKTNLDFLEQETVSGSGIIWVICKSASLPVQIAMPAPHHSFFYRPDVLPATQPTASKH